MSATQKTRNIGLIVTAVGVLVWAAAFAINIGTAKTDAGGVGANIGVGFIFLVGEFVAAYGVAIAVVFAIVSAVGGLTERGRDGEKGAAVVSGSQKLRNGGLLLALIGGVAWIEGLILNSFPYNSTGEVLIFTGMSIVVIGLLGAAIFGVSRAVRKR